METVGASLHELPWFLAYMGTAVALTLVYVVVYMWVTPHDEIGLIRENNAAAATAFGGSLLGFCLPLASAITNSASLADCAIWGGVALIVQIVIFFFGSYHISVPFFLNDKYLSVVLRLHLILLYLWRNL